MTYLDTNATTPCHKDVIEAMLPFLGTRFGNASSKYYKLATISQTAQESAKAAVARFFGVDVDMIHFTSGATESNNLVISGVMEKLQQDSPHSFHAITSSIEHKSVVETFTHLQKQGADVTFVEPNADGHITLPMVEAGLRENTKFASFMWVNNELGTVTDIPGISNCLAGKGICFHCDATQAALKIPTDIGNLPVDFVTFSAHKIYGPKGVGGICARPGALKKLATQSHGGGQSGGIRSGTFNTPGIVGMGKAFELVRQYKRKELAALKTMHDTCVNQLRRAFPEIIFNASGPIVPGCINFYLPGVNSDAIIFALKDDVCIASGSACAADDRRPSHVLKALAFDDERASNSFRLSFAYDLEEEAMLMAIELLKRTIHASTML